jgi:uncharacterized protein (DUF4213/DUF364 family)
MKDNTEILQKTLVRLQKLYSKEGLEPGFMLKVGIKPGWNVVIGSHGQCGMAMNFTDSSGVFGSEELDLERLKSFIGKDLFSVADHYITRSSYQERSIGVASISGLSQPLLLPDMLKKRGYLLRGKDIDLSYFLKPEDILTVVGYGGGIKRLLGKCRELHVTDIRPRNRFQTLMIGETIEYTPKEVKVHPEEENRFAIGKATVVWITGSSLINGTFKELMSYASGARLIGMYGASVSIIPDVLFEEGVDFIHSYRMSNPVAFEKGAFDDMHMEPVMQATQQQVSIERLP